MKILHVKDNKVFDITLGEKPEDTEDISYVSVPLDTYVDIDWGYSNGKIIKPNSPPLESSPTPDWLGFNTALLTNVEWKSWELDSDLRVALVSATSTANLTAFISTYNLAKQINAPSAEAKSAWQQLANDHHINIQF